MHEKIYKRLRADVGNIKQKIGPQCKKKVGYLFESIEENLLSLYKLVINDAKTGLYNSRFFDAMLGIEIEKAKRGQKLSLIIIDMDNLKGINDKYGHKKGDDALKQLSDVIKVNIRKSDIASRFGGDEFVILLPFASCRKATVISKRLKEKVLRDKVLSKYGVTLSIGIADFEKGDTSNKFFNKADFALLCAKKQGKNLTMSYEDI